MRNAPAKTLSGSGQGILPAVANAEKDLKLVLLGSSGTGANAHAVAQENAVLTVTSKALPPAAVLKFVR